MNRIYRSELFEHFKEVNEEQTFFYKLSSANFRPTVIFNLKTLESLYEYELYIFMADQNLFRVGKTAYCLICNTVPCKVTILDKSILLKERSFNILIADLKSNRLFHFCDETNSETFQAIKKIIMSEIR